MRKALALVLLVGCVRSGQGEATEVSRRVEMLHRQADKDRETIRGLENRVFLLEDKIDTLEVARAHKAAPDPELPVVTKRKEEPPPPPEEDTSGPDVIITLDESGAPIESRPARRRAARPLPRLDAGHDRIPTGPVPKIEPRDTEALTIYRSATEALGRRDHAAAIAGFKRFIDLYPEHHYADNAQYWLGEAYYDQADYKTALLEFKKVLARYPDGNKAPDALLKIAFCHAKLGSSEDARLALTQVVDTYPKTDAARLAEKRLVEEK